MNAAVLSRDIGAAAVHALLEELALYPKPGLVSLVDNGSHADMTAEHFRRSAESLRGYFAAMAVAGARGADFGTLRRLAVEAEVTMLRATGGVNTHRGAIFSVGLLAAAAGWHEARAAGTSLGELVHQRWGPDIAAHRRDPASHGSTVTRRHGAGGAQAEAAAGFPSLYGHALPAMRALQALRVSRADAALQAFFALLAHVQDTNLVYRGGPDALGFARDQAQRFLQAGGMQAPDAIERAIEVHRAFVARRLSPGGCADLLAACLFTATVEG